MKFQKSKDISVLEQCQLLSSVFFKFFDKIPPREREIYKYYCEARMRQSDIAQTLGLTQGAISHRISRMIKRLTFLKKLDDMSGGDPDDLFESLKEYCDPFEIEILRAFYNTTSQSDSADMVNGIFNLTGDMALNQVKIRYQFGKILVRLHKTKYFGIFYYIKQNLYLLNDVKLPHFK